MSRKTFHKKEPFFSYVLYTLIVIKENSLTKMKELLFETNTTIQKIIEM